MLRSKFEDLRRKKSYEEQRKLTLRIIADESGVSLGAVHRVSTGDIDKVYLSTLDKLCLYFGCNDINDLIEFSGNQPAEVRQ